MNLEHSVTLVGALFALSLVLPRELLLPVAAAVSTAFPLLVLTLGRPNGSSRVTQEEARGAKTLGIVLVLGLTIVELLIKKDAHEKHMYQVLVCMITSNVALFVRGKVNPERHRSTRIVIQEEVPIAAFSAELTPLVSDKMVQEPIVSSTPVQPREVKKKPETETTPSTIVHHKLVQEPVVPSPPVQPREVKRNLAAEMTPPAPTVATSGLADTLVLVPHNHVSGKEVSDKGDGQGNNLTAEQLEMCRSLHKTVIDSYMSQFRASNCEHPMTEYLDVDTCRRFLVARGWSMSKARTQLEQTIEWRMKQKPWVWMFRESPHCRRNPYAFNMRMIGMDCHHRPVLYSSFLHAYDRHHVEGAVQHLEMICEEARRLINRLFRTAVTSSADEVQWVWAIDFAGYSIRDTSPKMTYYAAKMMTNFPEMLNQIILMDAPSLFSGVFNVVNPILDDRVRSKINFVSMKSLHSKLEARVGSELVDWIHREGESIRSHKSSQGKRAYWMVQPDGHDPRGLASYVHSPYYVLTPGDAWKQENH